MGEFEKKGAKHVWWLEKNNGKIYAVSYIPVLDPNVYVEEKNPHYVLNYPVTCGLNYSMTPGRSKHLRHSSEKVSTPW